MPKEKLKFDEDNEVAPQKKGIRRMQCFDCHERSKKKNHDDDNCCFNEKNRGNRHCFHRHEKKKKTMMMQLH